MSCLVWLNLSIATSTSSFALVCKRWSTLWGKQHPTVTSYATPPTSVSQLQYSFDCGLGVRRANGEAFVSAVRTGNLDLVKVAHRNGCVSISNAHGEAAQRGFLDIIRWGRKNDDLSWVYAEICGKAARGGHMDIVQWARENGCPWDSISNLELARGGCLGMLCWARRNGCPWDQRMCSEAAAGGCLRILQYARKNGCEWDAIRCAGAAEEGHLHILQWARENGCPWDASTHSAASKKGHVDVLYWARKNGFQWDRKLCSEVATLG